MFPEALQAMPLIVARLRLMCCMRTLPDEKFETCPSQESSLAMPRVAPPRSH